MQAGEDTVPRPAPSPLPAPDAGTALDDTIGRGAVGRPGPTGPRIDSPPPVRLAAPPSGPALSVRARIRVGDGAPVVLATPVVVGRAPGQPRVGTVVRVPVASPRLQISADHLEIAQHGAAVVLRDLRSTNGSLVSIPGNEPRLLSRGDSIAVPVGTVVDLGEGIRIDILGPAESPDS